MSIERLKFRGMRSTDNQWIIAPDQIDLSKFWKGVEQVYIDPATVGQWTGLKDKNGVEIYEGDRMMTNIFGVGVVEYVNGSFYAHCPKQTKHHIDDEFLGLNKEWCETHCFVIGNVHEKEEK